MALAFERKGTEALERMPVDLRSLTRSDVPLKGFNMVGVNTLRRMLDDKPEEAPPAPVLAMPELPHLSALVDELSPPPSPSSWRGAESPST